MSLIDTTRLERIGSLQSGNHSPPNGEFAACVMEAVAYVAGEPWSDHPQCASPVITAFMIAWNDGLPNDAERDRLLKPIIPLIIGTRGSPELESRRATMAADWLVRVHTPAWLKLAGLTTEAEALSSRPEITDFAQTPSIKAPLGAARSAASKAGAAARDAAREAAGDAAGDAAWAAAWAAAGAAAWDAAREAAGDAARDAAREAAGDAARDAAWAAAGDAAWAAAWAAAWDAAREAAGDAARDAAWDALKPTQEALQTSALDLVKRMCALTDVDLAP